MQALVKHTPEAMHILDDMEQSPLHSAAKSGNNACVCVLLRAGARMVPQLPNNSGDTPGTPVITPLHSAATSGHLLCLQSLLSAFRAQKISINTVDSFGRSPLHFAAASGHESCIAALLAAGANPNILCAWGASPLLFAAKAGFSYAAEMLVGFGADINAIDSHSWSAMHFAAKNGDLRVIQLLLSRRANASGVSSDGDTPLCLALRAEHVDVACALMKAGASLAAAENIFPLLAGPVQGAMQKYVRDTAEAAACSLRQCNMHLGFDLHHAILCKVFDVEEPFLRLLLNAVAGGH